MSGSGGRATADRVYAKLPADVSPKVVIGHSTLLIRKMAADGWHITGPCGKPIAVFRH
jgi:hypothetical protein